MILYQTLNSYPIFTIEKQNAFGFAVDDLKFLRKNFVCSKFFDWGQEDTIFCGAPGPHPAPGGALLLEKFWDSAPRRLHTGKFFKPNLRVVSALAVF